MAESHLFLQRVLVSDHLPYQFMVSVPISPRRKRVAVGSCPLSHGCLRQARSLQVGWGVASEGAEGTGWLSPLSLRVACLRWLPSPTTGRKLSLVTSSKSQAVTSATSRVCPWAWPCRCSPPSCLETCGSWSTFGVGATGSPAGKFPRREGSTTPQLRFPLTPASLPPQCTGGGGGTPSILAFRSPHVRPATTCRNRCCPVTQAGVPLVPLRPRAGPELRDLGPATPAPPYQATEGT